MARINPQWAPVPSAQKIRKLYSKAGKRILYAALETPATEEQLDYARKVLAEKNAEQVVAKLLSMIDVAPPCPPREISEHIASESGGRRSGERPQGRKPPGNYRQAEPGRGGPRGPKKPGGGKWREGGDARRPSPAAGEAGAAEPGSGSATRFGHPKRRFR
jgi:hypothetical protein